MRIVIDRDLCQGHGNCTADAPEVFELDEDDEVKLLAERPGESAREAVEMAVKYCPTKAIRIVEVDK